MIAMRKVWLVVVQKYWRADRLGITDDRGCPDDEDGDADRERRDGEKAEGSRVLFQWYKCEREL
jgi:hypothetical protein